MLAILPWRRQQRNAAGQRFKHADGWDAGQQLRVVAARHMNRGEMLREDGGRASIGCPAMIIYAIALQCGEGLVRIAYPVDVEGQVSL